MLNSINYFFIKSFLSLSPGFPATIEYSATSFVITVPAPMIEPSPILTPGKIMAPYPIQTELPIRTFLRMICFLSFHLIDTLHYMVS